MAEPTAVNSQVTDLVVDGSAGDKMSPGEAGTQSAEPTAPASTDAGADAAVKRKGG
jgi:hypothetical protein